MEDWGKKGGRREKQGIKGEGKVRSFTVDGVGMVVSKRGKCLASGKRNK